jgi:hypothetical protein
VQNEPGGKPAERAQQFQERTVRAHHVNDSAQPEITRENQMFPSDGPLQVKWCSTPFRMERVESELTNDLGLACLNLTQQGLRDALRIVFASEERVKPHTKPSAETASEEPG